MGALKQLHTSDINVTPYTANKQWSFTYSNTPNDGYITYYIGANTSFSTNGNTTTNGEYKSSIYALVNQLYYQSYTASLDTSSLANSNYYISASSQRATSSYFDYTATNGFISAFPSSSGAVIGLLGISSNLYGNNILPYSIQISSSLVTIVDDGQGNLFDVTFIPAQYVDSYFVDPGYVINQLYVSYSYLDPDYFNQIFTPTFVGNVFYSQGNCVFTNSDYISFISNPISPINIFFRNNYTIQETEVRCIVKESEYNLTYNPTIQSGSLKNGTLKDFATGSGFSPYVTMVGLYNDTNDLLAVAKFSKPILISPHTDTTFIVNFDL
jgi:hypothetical protein